MTAVPTYGYMQLALLPRPSSEVEERIGRVAAESGGRLRRVFAEPVPPADALWSLIIDADRSMSGQLIPTVSATAEQRGMDVGRLLESGRRRTRAVAWQALLSELRTHGGTVIIPGPEHLDGLATSRTTALKQLSRIHAQTRLLCLPEPVARISQTDAAPVLVGEFPVKAFAAALEVTSLKAWWHLSQAGLSYLRTDVEAVLCALIEARMPTEPVEVLDEIRVRLQRTTHALLIEVHESENHSHEPIPDLVRQRCTRVSRCTAPTGGTITHAEIPLADTAPSPAR